MDRSWMLNPQAIRYAKECVRLVQEELGIRLKLSHPDFVQMLHEYAELTGSRELGDAYAQLIALAGVGNVVRGLAPIEKEETKTTKVVNLMTKKVVGASEPVYERQEYEAGSLSKDEMVSCGGKLYAKYRDGLEFKGLYRGQPSYA